jgi:hypothetical protein
VIYVSEVILMQKERWEILLESINNKMDLFVEMVNSLKKKNEEERIERSTKRKDTLLNLGSKERLRFLTSVREIRMESAKQTGNGERAGMKNLPQ